ncbi:MAG: aspartate kinase, partial [Dysgonamonadaceae bacterium]|nr:aspartate kinase [Dysgonamonadaceae bacterium]
MLTVEKIGGTSMSQFQDVLQNIIKGERKNDDLYNRIFVVSAYNNVTNWLLEHKMTGEPGIYNKFLNGEDYSSALDSFSKRLLLINDGFADIGLDLKEARDFIRFRVDQAKTL